MSFKDLTPEQRAAMQAKALATRAARKAAKAAKAVPEHTSAAESIATPATPPATTTRPGELSPKERALIRRKVEEEIARELRERRMAEREAEIQAETDRALQQARIDAGLVDISHKDDLITFVVDVAPFSDGIIIDGVRHAHGYEVTKPRHVYDSMRETMARSWDHEENAGYPNKKLMRPRGPTNTHNTTFPHAYMRPHETTISERTMVVQNRPLMKAES
jgi:hypothetical protein